MNDYKYHYLFTTFVSTLPPDVERQPKVRRTRKRGDPSVPFPGYRDLRPRGLQVQFRQYHCLPSGRRGGRRRARYTEGYGALPAVREYDPQQIESYTGKTSVCPGTFRRSNNAVSNVCPIRRCMRIHGIQSARRDEFISAPLIGLLE